MIQLHSRLLRPSLLLLRSVCVCVNNQPGISNNVTAVYSQSDLCSSDLCAGEGIDTRSDRAADMRRIQSKEQLVLFVRRRWTSSVGGLPQLTPAEGPKSPVPFTPRVREFKGRRRQTCTDEGSGRHAAEDRRAHSSTFQWVSGSFHDDKQHPLWFHTRRRNHWMCEWESLPLIRGQRSEVGSAHGPKLQSQLTPGDAAGLGRVSEL